MLVSSSCVFNDLCYDFRFSTYHSLTSSLTPNLIRVIFKDQYILDKFVFHRITSIKHMGVLSIMMIFIYALQYFVINIHFKREKAKKKYLLILYKVIGLTQSIFITWRYFLLLSTMVEMFFFFFLAFHYHSLS